MVLDVERRALVAVVIESVEGVAIVSEVAEVAVSGPTVVSAAIEETVRAVVMPVAAVARAGHAVRAAMLARGVSLPGSQWSAPHARTETSSEGE
jgi:hypothetical protein